MPGSTTISRESLAIAQVWHANRLRSPVRLTAGSLFLTEQCLGRLARCEWMQISPLDEGREGIFGNGDSMDFYTGLGLAWFTVHLLGIITTWMVRMHVGHRFEGLAQTGFLLSLLTVALVTVVGYHFCLKIWPISAVTLAAMIVLAVFDMETTRTSPARADI